MQRTDVDGDSPERPSAVDVQRRASAMQWITAVVTTNLGILEDVDIDSVTARGGRAHGGGNSADDISGPGSDDMSSDSEGDSAGFSAATVSSAARGGAPVPASDSDIVRWIRDALVTQSNVLDRFLAGRNNDAADDGVDVRQLYCFVHRPSLEGRGFPTASVSLARQGLAAPPPSNSAPPTPSQTILTPSPASALACIPADAVLLENAAVYVCLGTGNGDRPLPQSVVSRASLASHHVTLFERRPSIGSAQAIPGDNMPGCVMCTTLPSAAAVDGGAPGALNSIAHILQHIVYPAAYAQVYSRDPVHPAAVAGAAATAEAADTLRHVSSVVGRLASLPEPPRRVNPQDAAEVERLSIRSDVTVAFQQYAERWVVELDRVLAAGAAITTGFATVDAAAPVGRLALDDFTGATPELRFPTASPWDAERRAWVEHRIVACHLLEQLSSDVLRGCLAVLRKAGGRCGGLLERVDAAVARLRDAAVEAEDNARYVAELRDAGEPLTNRTATLESATRGLPGCLAAVRRVTAVASRFTTSLDRLTAVYLTVATAATRLTKRCLSEPQLLLDRAPSFALDDIDRALGFLCLLDATLLVPAGARGGAGLTPTPPPSALQVMPQVSVPARATLDGVSPLAVLGGTRALIQRLKQIRRVIDVTKRFGRLAQCELPPIAATANRVRMLVNVLRQSCPDPLDSPTFDVTLEEFCRGVSDSVTREAVAAVASVVGSPDGHAPEQLGATVSTDTITRSLKRVSRLRDLFALDSMDEDEGGGDEAVLPQIRIMQDEIGGVLEGAFRRDLVALDGTIERVRILYEAQRSRPPLERGKTPAAGAIAWARRLHASLRAPIEAIGSAGGRVANRRADVRRVTKRFNAIAVVLVTYEQEWYHHWCNTLPAVLSALHATLLTSDRPRPQRSDPSPTNAVRRTSSKPRRTPKPPDSAKTKRSAPPPLGTAGPSGASLPGAGGSEAAGLATLVNLDQRLIEALAEVKQLRHLGLPTPPIIRSASHAATRIASVASKLRHALGVLGALDDVVPSQLRCLIAWRVARVNEMLRPGLDTITWASLRASAFADEVWCAVEALEQTARKIASAHASRFERRVEAIRETVWIAASCRRLGLPVLGGTPTRDATAAAAADGDIDARAPAESPGRRDDGFFASGQGASEPIYDSLEALVREHVAHARASADAINAAGCGAAEGLQDVCLAAFEANLSVDAQRDIIHAAEEVFAVHEQIVQRALVASIAQSTKLLRSDLAPMEAAVGDDAPSAKSAGRPLLAVRVEHRDGSIRMQPSTIDLQRGLNCIVRAVLESTSFIYTWRQSRPAQTATAGRAPAARADAGRLRSLPLPSLLTESVAALQQDLSRLAEADVDKYLSARRLATVQASGVRLEGTAKAAFADLRLQTPRESSQDDPFAGPAYSVLPLGHHVQAIRAARLQSVYLRVGRDPAIVKAFLQLLGAFAPLDRAIGTFLLFFRSADEPFAGERHSAAAAFRQRSPPPTVRDYAHQLALYEAVVSDVDAAPRLQVIANVVLDLRPLRATIRAEAVAWMEAFAAGLTHATSLKLRALTQRLDEFRVRLARPLLELSDVTAVAAAVAELRDAESALDDELRPTVDAHDLLVRVGIRIGKDDADIAERAISARSTLPELAAKVQDDLAAHSSKFRVMLLQNLVQLDSSVEAYCREYRLHGPNVAGIDPRAATEKLARFAKIHAERQRQWSLLQQSQNLFRVAPRRYTEFVDIGRELALLSRLYDLYSGVLSTVQQAEELPWVDAELLQLEQSLVMYRERCDTLPRSLRDFPAFTELRDLLGSMLIAVPFLARLRERSVRPRHWAALSRIVGVELAPDAPDLRLKHLLDADLARFTQELDDLLATAAKEADIEAKLAAVTDLNQRVVTLAPYKTRGEVVLKSDATAELLSELEDSLTLLTSLTTNRHNEHFKRDIQLWLARVLTTQQRLGDWLDVQQSWLYLEAVFMSSGDIVREMPHEVKRFTAVDRQWCKLMAMAGETPKVLRLCAPGEPLSAALPHLRSSLDLCQQSLLGYVHAKRVAFPRFFFLSDPELLDILGNATDPTAITPHLPSLTSNVVDATFNVQAQLVSWSSAEGEVVRLGAPMAPEADVVVWLEAFLRAMRETLRVIAVQMHDDIHKRFADFGVREVQNYIAHFPGQIALLGIQILWSVDGEAMLLAPRARSKDAIATKVGRAKRLLDTMVEVSKDASLTPAMRTKLESLVTVQIHQLDVLVNLARNIRRVRGVQDFDWTKQLRCNWRQDRDEVVVSITDVDFAYGYEYIGTVERLVVTDLTDRIYISCAQAIAMGFGGAPTGPAGTGKTETTRDLGRACGRWFMVINCSELMSIGAMAKLVRGIAQSGCWCGFDEINRVDVGILSVVASQISGVFNALRSRRSTFVFTDGSVVPLDRECAIFVTMNPAYAGRTELPENMKSLFRSVAVVVPDRASIIRVRLAASGYEESVPLTKKLTTLYNAALEQLSQQAFYDFGLRNILSVLRTSGPALRTARAAAIPGIPVDEAKVVAAVVRSMNVSKLLPDDAHLFDRLIANLFPTAVTAAPGPSDNEDAAAATAAARSGAGAVANAIKEVLRQRALATPPDWTARLNMFNDQWTVRHGLCVMGPAGSGKSTLLSVMAAAVTRAVGDSKLFRVNPKAVPASVLFGSFDSKTGDWTDGILVTLWRRAGRRKADHNALVLDGPVDSVWIENLNSVLDDTRVFTLASGERLPLPPNLRLVFEVDDLRNASPATVSRLGLVCLSPSSIGWEPPVAAAVRNAQRNSLNRHTADAMLATITEAFDLCSAIVTSACGKASATFCRGQDAVNAMLTANMVRLINALVPAVISAQTARQRPGGAAPRRFSTVSSADSDASDDGASGNGDRSASPAAGIPGIPGIPGKSTASDAAVDDGRAIGTFVLLSVLSALLPQTSTWQWAAEMLLLAARRAEATSAQPTVASKQKRVAAEATRAIANPLDDAKLGALRLPTIKRGEDAAVIFDYCLEPTTLQWVSWSTLTEVNTRAPARRPSAAPARSPGAPGSPKPRSASDNAPLPFIPSPDFTRLKFFMGLFTRNREPFMLLGSGGTGKSAAAAAFLAQGDESVRRRFLAVSYATASTGLQGQICNALERQAGGSFGPRAGQSLALLFVDDVHLPEVSEWGDQPTSELMRFLIEDATVFVPQGHASVEAATVSRTLVAASMRPSDGVTSNDVPQRLKRHFAAIRIPEPGADTVNNIVIALTTGHFNVARGFSAEVAAGGVTVATQLCDVWRSAQRQFPTTSVRFHYCFNLGDLIRAVRGLLMARPPIVASLDAFVRLARFEACRTFGDKLVRPDEAAWLEKQTREVLRCGTDTLPPSGTEAGECSNAADAGQGVWWTCIPVEESDTNRGETVATAGATDIGAPRALSLDEDPEADDEARTIGLYQPYPLATVVHAIEARLRRYNEGHRMSRVDLVWSHFFVEHLVRVCRCLSTPRGNVLLVGVGGSGKRSLMRVATLVLDHRHVVLKSGDGAQTTEDTREGFRAAAMGTPVTFVLSDNDRHDNASLDLVSSLMAPGELPSVFPRDDLDQLLDDVRLRYRVPAGTSLSQAYTDAVRHHIHVALCFTPTDGEALRERTRRFPGFIEACTTIWFPAWPRAALARTAEVLLSEDVTAALGFRGSNAAVDKRHAAGAKPGTPSVAPPETSPRALLGRECAEVHAAMQRVYTDYAARMRRTLGTTPKTYLDFVASVNTEFGRLHNAVMKRHSAVVRGLQRMADVQKGVSRMQTELSEQQVVLKAAALKQDELLVDIGLKTDAAQTKTAQVQKERNLIKERADEIQREKDEADEGLRAALPALAAAEDALRTIKADDISAVKKFQTPPQMVRRILDGVLIIRGRSVDAPVQVDLDPVGRRIIKPSWASARAMINDMHFLAKLQKFDKDSLTPEHVELLEPYLRDPDFTVGRARTACGSLAGLCTWIRSMVDYFHIARAIIPKKLRLAAAEASLAKAMAELAVAEAELAAQQAELDDIKLKYDTAESEKAAMQRNAALILKRLETAEKLLHGLESERERWTTLERDGEDELSKAAGDALLRACFVSYLAPLGAEARRSAMHTVKQILRGAAVCFTDAFDPVLAMSTEGERAAWRARGLPRDALSSQNAVLLASITKYPFLVDPQGQGKSWVVDSADHRDRIIFTTLTSPNILDAAEQAATTGKTLVIENIASAAVNVGAMMPLMTQSFYRSIDLESGEWLRVIHLGAKELVVKDTFRLVMCTREAAPTLAPEFAAQVVVIECGATRAGLGEQLLGLAVEHERPRLEEERAEVQQEIAGCQTTLTRCEAALLDKLNGSSIEELLEDEELVLVFRDLKARAADVHKTLAAAEATERTIAEAREVYRPIADRGGALYFALLAMAEIRPVYVAALPAFVDRYSAAFDSAGDPPLPAESRNETVMRRLTLLVCHRFMHGFYASDKQLYLLLTAIAMQHDDAPTFLLKLLLRGPAGLELQSAGPAGASAPSRDPEFEESVGHLAWLDAEAAAGLVEVRRGLSASTRPAIEAIRTDPAAWKAFVQADAPERCRPFPWATAARGSIAGAGPAASLNAAPPSSNASTLTPLEDTALFALTLIRLLRPDRALVAARDYAVGVLGEAACTAPAVDFGTIAAACGPTVPIVCFLAEGVDPCVAIESASITQRASFTAVSMGVGQEEAARAAVARAAGSTSAEWVVLQNVHLTLPLCAELAETMRSLRFRADGAGSVNRGFRLFITTAPTPALPVALLQASYQVTDEPPRGLRAAMQRALGMLPQETLDSITVREWRVAVFAAAFIYSVLIERCKFGSAGWAAKYEFTPHDLSVAVTFLHRHFESDVRNGVVGWKAVQFMLGEVHFGGRITDTFDKSIVLAYCDRWLNDGVFANGFEFSPGYPALDHRNLAHCRSAIGAAFPAEDLPEACGLHVSAERAQNLAATRESFSRMLTALDVIGISTDAAGGPPAGGSRREPNVVGAEPRMAAMLDEIAVKLAFDPPVGHVNNMRARFTVSPLAAYCLMEVGVLRRVATTVAESVRLVAGCISGVEIETPAVVAVLTALRRSRTPVSWVTAAAGVNAASGLGEWLDAMQRRMAFFAAWLAKGSVRHVSMPALLFPRAFIASVRLELCKSAGGMSLDTAVLRTDVLRSEGMPTSSRAKPLPYHSSDAPVSPTGASSGPLLSAVCLTGLSLHGASWNAATSTMCEPVPHQTACPLPSLRLTLAHTGSGADDEGAGVSSEPEGTLTQRVEVPLYFDAHRGMQGYVMTLLLPANGRPASAWTISGTIATCNP